MNNNIPLKSLILINLFFSFIFSQGVHPTYKDSNQHFLEKILENTDLVSKLDVILKNPNLPSQDYRIGLIPIEKNELIDNSVTQIFEHHIIKTLVNSNYFVLERDLNAIKSMLKEGDEKYSLMFKGSSLSENESTSDSDIHFFETQLSSAEIVIFYRIIEVNISFRNSGDENPNEVFREGYIRADIRAQKMDTGRILLSTNIMAEYSDVIKRELIDQLVPINYTRFQHPINE